MKSARLCVKLKYNVEKGTVGDEPLVERASELIDIKLDLRISSTIDRFSISILQAKGPRLTEIASNTTSFRDCLAITVRDTLGREDNEEVIVIDGHVEAHSAPCRHFM